MRDEAEEGLDAEEIRDRAREEGELVFSLFWDNGGWGAGTEDVRLWRGQYHVFSLDGRPTGPFETLEEALHKAGLLVVNSAVWTIDCTVLSEKALLSLLEPMDDEVRIKINDEKVWAFTEQQGWVEWEDEEDNPDDEE